jgi:hypothetical protein
MSLIVLSIGFMSTRRVLSKPGDQNQELFNLDCVIEIVVRLKK